MANPSADATLVQSTYPVLRHSCPVKKDADKNRIVQQGGPLDTLDESLQSR